MASCAAASRKASHHQNLKRKSDRHFCPGRVRKCDRKNTGNTQNLLRPAELECTIQMIYFRDWWPWTKPGYITRTWRQSKNQWSGGIAAHPAPKNSECKNPLGNSLLEFLGLRQHPPHWLTSKGPNYQRGVLIISAGVIEGHFEEKTPREVHEGESCSCTTMPRLTGHVQPRWNRPTWASSVLITHPILWIWPRRTTTCSLDWKNNWKVAIFLSTRSSFMPWRPGWTDNFLNFYWVACKS